MSRRLSMSVAHKSTSGSFLEIPQVVDPVGNPSLLIANTVAALRLATPPSQEHLEGGSNSALPFSSNTVAPCFRPIPFRLVTRLEFLGSKRRNGLRDSRALPEAR
jgi:hypothetical protein